MLNDLELFAKECVENYAVYDGCDRYFDLSVSELPDFVQHEFAALIMSHDESFATEATGPDNKHWDDKMLPALNRYLLNSTDKDEAIEFNKIWRDCVTDHLKSIMEDKINDALFELNSDHGYLRETSYYTGIPAYGQI